MSNLIDPQGHEWMPGSSVEELTNEEIRQRFSAMLQDTNRLNHFKVQVTDLLRTSLRRDNIAARGNRCVEFERIKVR